MGGEGPEGRGRGVVGREDLPHAQPQNSNSATRSAWSLWRRGPFCWHCFRNSSKDRGLLRGWIPACAGPGSWRILILWFVSVVFGTVFMCFLNWLKAFEFLYRFHFRDLCKKTRRVFCEKIDPCFVFFCRVLARYEKNATQINFTISVYFQGNFQELSIL